MLAMGLAPKFATLADVLARREPAARLRRRGADRDGAFLEFVFSVLIAPISAVAVTLFVLGLPFGRRVGWTSQQRDARRRELSGAARKLWPQTLFGIFLMAWFWHAAPGAVWYWVPLFAGLAGSIPFAMVDGASAAFGRALAAAGICRIPEEARSPAGIAGTRASIQPVARRRRRRRPNEARGAGGRAVPRRSCCWGHSALRRRSPWTS